VPDGTRDGDQLYWVIDSVNGDSWVADYRPEDNMQPFLGLNYVIALVGIFPSRNSGDPLLGEIMMVGFNFAPRGWAFCDGQLLAISSNTALFSLLGTTYGGDGRTTFALPDLRGRVPLHKGNGPGLSSRTLGERGGVETH
jgi:microcystin-dependent protein